MVGAAVGAPMQVVDFEKRLAIGVDERDVVAAVEAERHATTTPDGAADDFDAMASHDLAEAIWLVGSRDAAHDLVEVLYDPPTGPRRLEKSYSRSTKPEKFTYDTPGLSEVVSVSSVIHKF